MPQTKEEKRLQEIQKLLPEIAMSAKVSVEQAIKLGGLLLEQREAMKAAKSRNWMAWIEENVPGFSRTTVANYIEAYKHRDKIDLQKICNLTDSYRAGREGQTTKSKPEIAVRIPMTKAKRDEWGEVMLKLSMLWPGELCDVLLKLAKDKLQEADNATSNPSYNASAA